MSLALCGMSYLPQYLLFYFHDFQAYVLLMVSNNLCALGVTLMPILSTALRFFSKAMLIFFSTFSGSRLRSDGAGFVGNSVTSMFLIWDMFSILTSTAFFFVFLDDSTTC